MYLPRSLYTNINSRYLNATWSNWCHIQFFFARRCQSQELLGVFRHNLMIHSRNRKRGWNESTSSVVSVSHMSEFKRCVYHQNFTIKCYYSLFLQLSQSTDSYRRWELRDSSSSQKKRKCAISCRRNLRLSSSRETGPANLLEDEVEECETFFWVTFDAHPAARMGVPSTPTLKWSAYTLYPAFEIHHLLYLNLKRVWGQDLRRHDPDLNSVVSGPWDHSFIPCEKSCFDLHSALTGDVLKRQFQHRWEEFRKRSIAGGVSDSLQCLLCRQRPALIDS